MTIKEFVDALALEESALCENFYKEKIQRNNLIIYLEEMMKIGTDILFVGEAPGESEDLSGIPFVGAAGKLFDKYLSAVGIDRDDVYIANILKCRPPHNRDPESNEEDACMEYLREQIRLISPDVIVCLGRISAMRLIKPDFRITKEHGIWHKKGNFKVCAVYHPSALLRDPSKREEMLKDMIEIKRVCDLCAGSL
jgi:DNA polymerase